MNENDSNEIIEQLGISKRLGNSILDELNQRASETNPLLRKHEDTDNEEERPAESTPTAHNLVFNKVHNLNFENLTDKDPDFTIHNDPLHKKKYKYSPIKRVPEVNEITKKIRRLKLRSSSNLSSSGGSPEKRTTNASNVEQKTELAPLKTPNFLRPTFNSMNRAKDTSHKVESSRRTYGNLLPPTSRAIPAGKEAVRQDYTKRSISIQLPRKSPAPPKISEQRSISDSSSNVFERLYKQTTMSRSNSMAFDQQNRKQLPKSRTMTGLSSVVGDKHRTFPSKHWCKVYTCLIFYIVYSSF